MVCTNLKLLVNVIYEILACIFDLDGTMLDTLGIWNRTDEFVINRYGQKPSPSLHELQLGRDEVVRDRGYVGYCSYLIDEYQMKDITDPNELLKIRWAYADELLRNLDYKPGVVRFIKGVKAMGKKIGLATMSTAHQIEVYEKLNQKTSSQLVFHDEFDYVGLKDDVTKNKPDPEIYLKACNALGISPSQGIVFEDALEGVESAKRAGLIVVAVRDDHNEAYFEQIKARADFWLESFEELADLMKF